MVYFQRVGDAAIAHSKYDGKIVDGRECFVLKGSRSVDTT